MKLNPFILLVFIAFAVSVYFAVNGRFVMTLCALAVAFFALAKLKQNGSKGSNDAS